MALREQFDIRIPSDTSAGMAVQSRIIDRLEDLGFPPRDVFGVRLALEEGLINAIKHGNRLDPQKQVQVTCRIEDEFLSVRIEDEGPGFKPEDIPDCTLEENLERASGRGIMLMRAFMSHVEYQGRGNVLLLEKRRTSSESAA